MTVIRPLSEIEFRDAVTFVAYQLEHAGISRTLAASDLRRFIAGRALDQNQKDRRERQRAARQRVFDELKPHAKTPLDLGVARFAADIAELTGR